MRLAPRGAGPPGEQKSQGFLASRSSMYVNNCGCVQTEVFARSVGYSGAGGMGLTLVQECFTEEGRHCVLKSGEGAAGKGNCQEQRPEMGSPGFDVALTLQ